ncbi:MAG: DHH family phosphoesterase, partial [Candidatus Thorarchaeota archaeon]
MFRPKVVSISHKIDPDGIGSQAILFRYFKELKIEPIGLLADYHDFEDAFNKALEEKPNILIITDIGVNETFLSKIIVSLRDLNARKIWIDHHKMTVNQKVQISEAVTEFIHDTTVCAAELVQKRFMPNDETSKKIALIGHNGDFDINDRLTQIYYTLIDYYRNSIEDLEYIRDILIKGN